MCACALAGFTTAWLNVRLKIMDLLASILMMIALSSINLRVMGKPNIALIDDATVFSLLDFGLVPDYVQKPLVLLVIVIAAKVLLDLFFAELDRNCRKQDLVVEEGRLMVRTVMREERLRLHGMDLRQWIAEGLMDLLVLTDLTNPQLAYDRLITLIAAERVLSLPVLDVHRESLNQGPDA